MKHFASLWHCIIFKAVVEQPFEACNHIKCYALIKWIPELGICLKSCFHNILESDGIISVFQNVYFKKIYKFQTRLFDSDWIPKPAVFILRLKVLSTEQHPANNFEYFHHFNTIIKTYLELIF